MLLIIKKGNIVNMTPTKEFFIYSLVRDIDLKKAIFELIDNSIQGAKRFINNNNFFNYYIRITINKNNFIIEDNCGGISKKDICNYAFRFGYENDSNLKEFSFGGFGIGMKRAFFKIGNKIILESNNEESYFSVNLDVNRWKKEKDWNINLDKEGKSKKREKGTTIIINELYEDISKEFSSKKFINKLNKEITERYEKEIEKNLEIEVNKEKLCINREKEKEIYKESHIVNDVLIRIVINNGSYSENKSGWNIYLNGRKVISTDKTKLTGWGYEKQYDEFETPKFQERFYTFRGYVYLESKNPYVLPFNTTKDGIDINSYIYKKMIKYMIENFQKALPKIDDGSNTFITYPKPVKEVEMLKNFLKVKSARQVGIRTYEEYLKNFKINNKI